MYKEPGAYTNIEKGKEVKFIVDTKGVIDDEAPITSTDKTWSVKKNNTEFAKVNEVKRVSSELENVKTNKANVTDLATDLKLTGTKLQLKKSDGSVVGTGVMLPTTGGGSSEIITPNGNTITIKAFNDGTLETELTPILESELPSDFPKFTITGESKYKGNFLVTPHSSNYDFGYIFILNNKGEILWYKRTDKGYCYAFKKYKNSKSQNRYTYLEVMSKDFATSGGVGFYENCELVVLNENFDEIDRVRHKKSGNIPNNYPSESHDYMYIDDGHYVLLSYFRINDEGKYENSIQEIKMGKVVFHWETLDSSVLATLSHTSPTGDYAHINSIQIDYDNNFLISFRNIGLVKLNKTTKEIMWVIGRNRCDFTGIEASQIPFQQHDIQLVADGSFTVFDNYGHTGNSRVCRYMLDEQNKICLKYKEYITTFPKSGYMGSATIVDDKNDILDIAYGGGMNIGFEEYDFINKKQLMALQFNDGHDMYRVFRDLDFKNNSKFINLDIENKYPLLGISMLSELSLTIGGSHSLIIEYNPTNATNKRIEYKSSNNDIATVEYGKITAIAKGNCTITATSKDGGHIAICNLTVIGSDTIRGGSIVSLVKDTGLTDISRWKDCNGNNVYLEMNNVVNNNGTVFNGSTSYGELKNASISTSSNFSIGVKFKVNEFKNYSKILMFSKNGNNLSDGGIRVECNASKNISATFYDYFETTARIVANEQEYYTVIITFNSTTRDVKVYINGELSANSTGNDRIYSFDKMYLSKTLNDNLESKFNGVYDFLTIYDYELKLEEVQKISSEGI